MQKNINEIFYLHISWSFFSQTKFEVILKLTNSNFIYSIRIEQEDKECLIHSKLF
jgi:hypothetical protein